MSPFWSGSGTEAHVSKIWVELTASADTFSGAAEGTARNELKRLVMNLPANAGDARDASSIPRLGKFSVVRNGDPL